MWTIAIFKKSYAAAMCGHLIPYPKKMYDIIKKSIYERWVGKNIIGKPYFYYNAFNFIIETLSITTC